ncbi:winged helix-turn-helix domain-containing protein [Pseudomonas sp. SIMBA_077]
MIEASMAKSRCFYVFGLGNMPSTGCKNNIFQHSVLNFARTQVLVEDINELTSSEAKHFDTSNQATLLPSSFAQVEAVFLEIYSTDVINQCVDLVKKIRLCNQTACIFILVTHKKSFSGVNSYLAGADHCLKLPNAPQEKKSLLLRALEESHWRSPIQLYLDRTRLLLCSTKSRLEISYSEMTIIDALIQAPEHVMSQDSIAKALDPNISFYDPRALEKTISRLRTKIKKAYNIELIISVRAYGYRLRRGTVSR